MPDVYSLENVVGHGVFAHYEQMLISLYIFKGHLIKSMLPDLCTYFSISYADKREKSVRSDVTKKVEGDAADICQQNTPACNVGKIFTQLGYFKNP